MSARRPWARRLDTPPETSYNTKRASTPANGLDVRHAADGEGLEVKGLVIRSVSRNTKRPRLYGRAATRRRRRRGEASRFAQFSATMAYYRSGAPLLRYWWLVAIGVVVSAFVVYLAIQAKRAPYQYTATGQVLVTSPEAPYFRFSITREGTRPVAEDAPPEVVVDTGPPDTVTLVQAANLYPLLLESDLVATERMERFGSTPGTIEAQAVFAVQTPNRFSESSVPVIDVSATSPTREDAVKLADDTVAAFAAWITKQQDQAGVSKDQRILISPITSARVVSQTGGPSYAIPLLLGVAVLLAFCGLAVMFDALARRSRALMEEQVGPVPFPLSAPPASDETRRGREVEGSA